MFQCVQPETLLAALSKGNLECGIPLRMNAKLTAALDSVADWLWSFLKGFAILFLLACLASAGVWIWNQLDEHTYIPHDKLTTVSSGSWSPGEYKDCFTLNVEMEQPVLNCNNLLGSAEKKVFKVRFYGETHIEGQSKDTTFRWDCTRNEEIN